MEAAGSFLGRGVSDWESRGGPGFISKDKANNSNLFFFLTHRQLKAAWMHLYG